MRGLKLQEYEEITIIEIFGIQVTGILIGVEMILLL